MGLTPTINSQSNAESFSRPWQNVETALRVFNKLCKVRLTFLAALTASFGYIMFDGSIGWGALTSFMGVFWMSNGGIALNQLQEQSYDSKMLRTQARPLVQGHISQTTALLLGLGMLTFGTLLLHLTINPIAAFLGIIAIVWYNGIYTYLKRVTALAVIPGSVVGALPPMIGWVAAGGSLTDPTLLMVALFFLIWQIPHFWLLLMLYGKDYERGGFPSLTERFSLTQLKWLTLTWILLMTVEACLIPIIGHAFKPTITISGMIAVSVWMVLTSLRIFPTNDEVPALRRTFHCINLYMVFVMLLLCIDRF